MVHARLTSYLEDNGYIPDTMFGFRQHLSTQDILLLLKEDIIDHLDRHHKSCILAVDVKGAFDNVKHEKIFEHLQSTNCGPKAYNYARNFLTNRTATVGIGNLRGEKFQLPNKGTPQGSVVSPLLFNIAMLHLPKKLKAIEGLRHALYADDFTLWARAPTTGKQQDSLQEAIDVVVTYLDSCGLQCAPDKSELLVLKARTRGRPPKLVDADPSVTLYGVEIPKVNSLRGAQRTRHLTDHSSIITSRMTYGTPYLALKSAEIKKMDIMIRKATKTALGVPFMASTDKLLKLGVHNTWEEMAEAHKASQLERLKLTSTGRAVLRYLNYSETYIADTDEKARLPLELREAIFVARIPRNMHPSYHKKRREARSKALLRKYAKDPNTRYTDAARYPDHTAFAVSVTDQRGRKLASATIPARNPEMAEEAAIALAMTTCSDRALIFTDSQAACRNFQKGRVSATALKILKTRPQLPDAYITWIPGHEGMAGNEAAHAAAREHTSRAFLPPNIRAATGAEEVPTTYRAILEHYRLERRRYPPPHLDLTKEESVILRRLQTNTYAHGIIMHRIYPTQFPYLCPYCDIPDTLPHMILECPCEDRRPDPPVDSRASSTIQTSAPQNNASAHTTGDHDIAEKWEALLVSEDPENQKNLVNRAKTAATARGFLD
ncbi:uncharacterized protein LOC144144812 [Haemaphysalis longicornis]